ncbi:protein kinase [Angomonas deanei]|uniref:mitogen-activated protein kinase kinase n=1 Tax=Angomonas deanei TaxID=59799 RepID=S9WNI9_9TRYP|nr:protein kinase [Angomonas deanei]EPY40741.1 protein kinase [Angomonas deanei]CAD2218621.1 Protein kinase domain/Protein tyrosine kinase, putative [Angomonas deanei]|eukprot:EPY25140.1 protein kinase [Angomonas deanei]
MKKRPGLALDAAAVESYKNDIQSYQIKNNNSIQLRAFLFNENGMYTKDGRKLPGTVTKDQIDFGDKKSVGRGASGDVSFARLKDGTPVALKCIPISSKTHRDEVDRELQFFSSKNDSPFVMKNYGAFWDSDQGCIVIPMEWMSYTVKDLSFFWDGLDESILRDVYFQVVSGLMYLHDTKRVIHRDLKPSNLLINERGFVKIADFGVSKLVQTLDVSSTYVGTMYFMAPERLEQGAYSFSSDVWSLGLTMVATVTGRNPWAPPEEMNLFQLLGKISGDTTPSLPATGNYSAEARDFIQKCLVRDPEERLSCAELLAHPFFKGVTMESAVANVKLAVECMTRMVSLAAKKDKEVQRSQEEMAKDVQSKLDKIVK